MTTEQRSGAASSTAVEPEPARTSPAAEVCPWEIDALLAKVDAPSAMRTNCGLTNGAFTDQIQTGFDCLMDARARDEGAELTIIQCIDCWIADTFVTLPSGALYRIFTEYDSYGDSIRVSRVDTCSDVSHTEGSDITCARPAQLFVCQGALSDVR